VFRAALKKELHKQEYQLHAQGKTGEEDDFNCDRLFECNQTLKSF